MGERPVRVVIWLLLAGAWLVLGACKSESHGPHHPEIGGETNWLRACDGDADCSVGSCVCGVCSEDCVQDEDCPSGLRCEGPRSALYRSACGAELEVDGLCAPTCEDSAQCGAELVCGGGACLPSALVNGDGGVPRVPAPPIENDVTLDDGPFQLVVDAHVDQTPECTPDLGRPIGSGAGMYDIGGSGAADRESTGTTCSKPYMLSLRVRNLLPEDVLITDAKVLMMSVEEQIILFTQTQLDLPNPFDLTVTGSVPAEGAEARAEAIIVEAIPIDYAEQLAMFVNSQLALRVQLVGQTLSGEPVQSNQFDYRVPLCSGCLIGCATALDDAMITVEEFIGAGCDDRAAADGRYCFDPEC